MNALAKSIDAVLAKQGTKTRADGAKAYLKSDLAFYGCEMPKLRKAVLELAREVKPDHDLVIETVEALWPRGNFELRAAAVELLVKYVKLLGPDDVALLERLIRESKTWALVDSIAPFVMGTLFIEDPELGKTLDRWAKDPDFWVRRAAMLSLLIPLRKGGGDFERFGRYADAQLEDTEFFIRKAIGWILRETSKQRPKLVYDWLLPRADRAAGLTIREATKYLTPKQRAAIEAARE